MYTCGPTVWNYAHIGNFRTFLFEDLLRRYLEYVGSDEYAKEDVRDFALWKLGTPDDEAVGAAWDAPFGRGRPGWHLECSAMALSEVRSRFGVETLDVHAGGVDLIFPHHENEIAQS